MRYFEKCVTSGSCLHLTVQKSRLWSYQKVIRLSSLIQSKLLEIIVDYIRGEQLHKMLVTHRLKRSGQRWGRDGGQGVLAFRALLKSDRFDRAWPMLVPRVKRSKQHWDPPKIAANDDWQILKYA